MIAIPLPWSGSVDAIARREMGVIALGRAGIIGTGFAGGRRSRSTGTVVQRCRWGVCWSDRGMRLSP
ncbi:MAG: hypothetical protein WCD18_12540 [Thermosynechococcaceae cyanobacterium]